jgi:hypothetical protein
MMWSSHAETFEKLLFLDFSSALPSPSGGEGVQGKPQTFSKVSKSENTLDRKEEEVTMGMSS